MFPPGHPPSPCHIWSCTSKSLPTGYFCTKKQSKLPAWMLLFEPCALKHGLALWLFLTHSSSRAAFSEAMQCNVDLGPQETQVRQIYHNLLHGYSFGFWHPSPDSSIKHPLASKDQSKPSLLWFLLRGWEPFRGLTQHFLTLLSLVQTSSQCGEPILKARSTRWHLPAPAAHPPLHPPQLEPASRAKSTSSCPVPCPVLHAWLRASWKSSDILQLENAI